MAEQLSANRQVVRLKDILPMELAVPASYADDLLQMYDPILLLDGLDEIPQEHQNSFLEALGRYGANPNRKYAISSRIAEYGTAEKDAPVYAQIEIDQITFAQLSTSFQEWSHSEPEARPMLQALEKEPLLKEVIRIPFYLNLLHHMGIVEYNMGVASTLLTNTNWRNGSKSVFNFYFD